MLASAIPQHELAIGIHISPPFWTSLPPPFPSHPSRLIQSPCLSFLRHTANSRWLFILHMVMSVSMVLFPHILPSSPLSPCLQVYSLCLFFHCCPVNKFFSTTFLDSIYMHSVDFSCSVMSDSLRPHGLQHARPPCPSLPSEVYSNLCPLSWWCHPTISSSVIPFPSHLQSFPASGSFQMSHFFSSGGQSVKVSASTPVLPMNIQDWFPLGWNGCTPRDPQESSPTTQFKSINSLALSFLHSPTLPSIHDHWKNHSLD